MIGYGYTNGDKVLYNNEVWEVYETFGSSGGPCHYWPWTDHKLDVDDERKGIPRSRWKFCLKKQKNKEIATQVPQCLVRHLTEEEKCLLKNKRQKKEDFRSYLEKFPERLKKLLASRSSGTPVDLAAEEFLAAGAFLVYAERLSTDPEVMLTYSAKDDVTAAFREEYEKWAGVPLVNHGDVHDNTKKRNTICSRERVDGLSLMGVEFVPWFGSTEKVLAKSKDRAAIWWGLIQLGFRIGKFGDQDCARIADRIAVARENLQR